MRERDVSSGISGRTKLIALVGSPIAHSGSPAMQNAAFRAAGLDLIYLAFDVPLDKARDVVAALRTLNVRGANVTMPLKKAVVPWLDRLSPAAELAGAVNTIVNDGGVLTGHITDGEGYMMALAAAGVAHQGRRMTILGAGGAASAVAIQAAMDGVRGIAMFNRHDGFFKDGAETVAMLRSRFGCDATLGDLADLSALRSAIDACDILINATPIGMNDTLDCSALPDITWLRSDLTVSDLIYVPKETYLLKQASKAGCRTVSGLGMQLYQGVQAFKLWTGLEMPVDIARNALAGRDEG